MTFDPNAQLDPGQITDRRGMGGRGGLAIGGGGIGVVLFLAYILLGGDPSSLGPLLEPGAVPGPGSTAIATDCKTGQDANTRDDCRILGYVNSIQSYWTDAFAASGERYQRSTRSCSRAGLRAAVAPQARLRVPSMPDRSAVYLDLDFFTELGRGSARGAARWPRAMCSPMNTVTIQDLLGSLNGSGAARAGAARSGRSCRPTFRRGVGEPRGQHQASSRSGSPSRMRSMPRRPSATIASSRRRPAR
jgi:predicted metalloprotease